MDAEQQPAPVRARPESIAARNFSEDLDTLFGLHSGITIGNLNETVQEKKRTVSTQEQELAALESRLREAEERLAHAAGTSPPSQNTALRGVSPGRGHQASIGAEEDVEHNGRGARRDQSGTQPGHNQAASTRHVSAGLRPSNARAESFNPHIPGAMPRTPTPRFEGTEYVTVDRSR